MTAMAILHPRTDSLVGTDSVNLFASVAKDCRIVRLTDSDACRQSDVWRDLETLVLPSEEKYPRIDRWLRYKVAAGLTSHSRHVFVGYYGGQPAVAAIVKIGTRSKFCHLSVAPSLRGRNVGELFFALMTMSVHRSSTHLRFTLPEGLWESERSFFESFYVRPAIPIEKQYRRSERELFCEAPLVEVWPHVIKKIAKLRQAVSIDGVGWDQDLILSVRPHHAQHILAGTKTVEIRRAFATSRAPATCVLYASSPVQEVVGQVDVVRATKLDPGEAWRRFGGRMHCSKRELDEYASGAKTVCVLELGHPIPYPRSIALATIRAWLGSQLRPPQSHVIVSNGSGWECAMPVIAMLQPQHCSDDTTACAVARSTIGGRA